MTSHWQVNKEALCEVEERFKGKRFKARRLSCIYGCINTRQIEDHKGESELQHFFTDCMKLFFAACVSVTNAFLICWLRFQCFLHLFRPITKCFEADIQRSYMSSFFNFLPESVDFSIQMIFSLQLPNVWLGHLWMSWRASYFVFVAGIHKVWLRHQCNSNQCEYPI